MPVILRNLKLRWKMVAMVLPLVAIPIFLVGTILGYVSNHQAYLGITRTSMDDLDHLAQFTVDLLGSHYLQFQVYRQDKRDTVRKELAALVNLASTAVQAQQRLYARGRIDRNAAVEESRKAVKSVQVGETGYLYAMTSKGLLTAHVVREGENIYDERDEAGRYFIREMCDAALRSRPGEVLYTSYPWRNAALGEARARQKVVAYRYLRDLDWIVAAGGYLDETSDDAAFERRSFAELKQKIKAKRVGTTGYIYALTKNGDLKIHIDREGANILGERDDKGRYFIREMCEKKNGWIRYPWRNIGDEAPRMKIVRYRYFAPWDWIVAVGCYEDEFYAEANKIKGRIVLGVVGLTVVACLASGGLVLLASKVFTDPIRHMTEVVHGAGRGGLEGRMEVASGDEIGELAAVYNRMADTIEKNKKIEASLAEQEKMASLGVLASGVAHEINNPLGVILGYAGYLEGKLDPTDANYRYIQDIRRESKRCRTIVQDLLNYARTPKPVREEVDLNALLDQILGFASNHADLRPISVVKEFDADLPGIWADPNQLRQVALNLALNAGAAMGDAGRLTVRTALDPDGFVSLVFQDDGPGIAPENLEHIFEPFFTTKAKGTGLGLAITKRIVEQHLGSIAVDSAVGRGTRVTVRLPVASEEA